MEEEEKIKKYGKYIGKDITGRKIYFARQDKVSEVYGEVVDFVEKIFGVKVAFISDESSLEDFLGTCEDVGTINDIVKKVKKLYKTDISPVKDKPLVDIVRFVLDL